MKAMTVSASELESVLRIHAGRYPLLQPRDAVKLIYQNEFGGGHLISDAASCLNYLRREYGSVAKDPAALAYEDIGNGILRVNLACVAEEELEQLGKAFIRSAAEHTGAMDSFLQKLDVLRLLTGEGMFSFGTAELEGYLAAYAQEGYPQVSHSEMYRKHYHPAYRVVLAKYWVDEKRLGFREESGK